MADKTEEVLAEAPVPEAIEISITIIGTRYDVNINGASVFEVPVRLRIAAQMVERQLLKTTEIDGR